MTAREKALSKVAKLLALAEEGRGGSEAEREVALARAQSLMTKHRIEERELVGQAGRSALPGIEQQRWEKFGLASVWKGQLAHEVGRGVGVDAIHLPKLAARRYWLVGRPDDIEYVKLVVAWVVPQLERDCRRELKEFRAERPHLWAGNPGSAAAASAAFNRSFYEAAVDSISDRLAAARREDAEMAGGSALVLSDRKALDDFYGDNAPKQTRESVYAGYGSAAGAEAGKVADINPSNKVESGAAAELGS